MRNREILGRQFRIVVELHRHPAGLSSERLAAKLDVSRPTIDRDLALLRGKVRLPIKRVPRNGEVWHRLDDLPLASVAATPLQVAALRLARQALDPLAGTRLVDEVDGLLALLPRPAVAESDVDLGPRSLACDRGVVRTLDRALAAGRRLALQYRVATRGGAIERYEVDPLTLRFVDGTLYLFGWAANRSAPRTFKVSRIESADVLDVKAAHHPSLLGGGAFKNAVKAWSGEPARVRVRLRREVAWMVHEYPLIAHQRTSFEPDGSALVEAEVAGIVEASRWVLSWGRHASVIEPKSLRSLVVGELRQTLAGYDDHVRSSKVSDDEGGRGSQASRKRAKSKGPASDEEAST
jgi:predicted DNA-binding transcriptional regulator YafY